ARASPFGVCQLIRLPWQQGGPELKRQSFTNQFVAACAAVLAVMIPACDNFPVLPLDRYVPKYPPSKFVHWETPHVSPMALSTDGATLLAVNTPDARLEVFDVSGDQPVWRTSIPVGLDPVSVRFASPTEAWVVNHVSDSISIVNLDLGTV